MIIVSLIIRKLETKWNLNPIKKAFLGGSEFYGFFIGSLYSGTFIDKKGRKYTFIIECVIFFIFVFDSSFSIEF